MAKEAPEKSFPTVCGAPQCQCTMIMSHMLASRTPFFFADNNFTRKTGPRLPANFVQQHKHEMTMVINLEASGKVFAVQLEVGETGEDDSVSMGLGWESFMVYSKFHAEDLLFFMLEGQSRFVVLSVRGHNQWKADAEPEEPKGKLKPSEMLLSGVLEGGTSSLAKQAAKEQKPGQTSKTLTVRHHPPLPQATLGSGEGAASQEPIPVQHFKTNSTPANASGKQHVTVVSSHDALESYMPLLESSHSVNEDTEMEEPSGEFEKDHSDYEDETEFKSFSRRRALRGAR